MAIAVSWVKYDSETPDIESSPFKHDLPFLDMGTYRQNSWSEADNLTDVRKFVLGLRIQGSAAENIKIWMDGDRFDSYVHSSNQIDIKQNHQERNYIFKITDLDDATMGWFEPCRTATTLPLDDDYAVTYNNGTSGVGATLSSDIDVVLGSVGGVAVVVGDRILVKNQTDVAENGIYVVTSLGVDGSAPWILTRALDLNQSDEIVPTMRVLVTYDMGAVDNEYYGLYLDTASPYTMGTTEMYWVEQPREIIRLSDCRLSTDGSDIGSYSSGIITSAPSVVDGVDVRAYDRILVKDQDASENNGVYYVNVVGTGANGIWSRVQEFNSSEELINQLSVKVTEGDTNANKIFLINFGIQTPAFILDTTSFTWGEYVPLTVYEAHSKTWNNLGITYESAMNIGNANITVDRDSYSHRFGLAMYAPDGEAGQRLRNIHLMAQFDTSDE